MLYSNYLPCQDKTPNIQIWRKVCVFNYRKKFHTFVFIVVIILHTITKYFYLYMIFFFISQAQSLGLKTAYRDDTGTRRYIRKLMALPLIPVGSIRPQFEVLAAEAVSEKLIQLCNYIRNTWLDSTTFKPETWCHYKSAIRTNNDLEGE